jgi:hypothetical protein
MARKINRKVILLDELVSIKRVSKASYINGLQVPAYKIVNEDFFPVFYPFLINLHDIQSIRFLEGPTKGGITSIDAFIDLYLASKHDGIEILENINRVDVLNQQGKTIALGLSYV